MTQTLSNYLPLLLLMLAMLISILEVLKEMRGKSFGILKWLCGLYIVVFIAGAIQFVLDQKGASKMSDALSSILSKSDDEMNALSKSLKQTQLLVKKIEETNKGIADVVAMRDAIINRAEAMNVSMERQIKIDSLNFLAKRAIIDLVDERVKWVGTDSTSYKIEACLANEGGRMAVITKYKGNVLFFNNNRDVYFNIDINNTSVNQYLAPNSGVRNLFCITTNGMGKMSFSKLKQISYFVVLYLQVEYFDKVLNKTEIEDFYWCWRPIINEFGGMKDWEKWMVNDWLKKYGKHD